MYTMKKTLIIGLLILGNSVFGQIPGKRIDGPIVLFDTLTIKKGDIIYLGNGSDPKTGDFIHIYRPKNKVIPIAGEVVLEEFTDQDINFEAIPNRALDKGFAGKNLVVEQFSAVSSKKNGKRILGVMDLGGYAFDGGTIALGNVVIDFEPAIMSGEIIKIMTPELIEKAPMVELKLSQFEMTKKGIEPIVVAIKNLSKNDLYNKTLDWTNSFYMIPNDVTITSVPDEQVKINGLAKNVKVAKMFGVDMYGNLSYLLVTDFIEGEIRMTFTLGDERGNITEDVSQSDIFDKKGEVYKPYKDFKQEIEKLMNDLSFALVDYLMK